MSLGTIRRDGRDAHRESVGDGAAIGIGRSRDEGCVAPDIIHIVENQLAGIVGRQADRIEEGRVGVAFDRVAEGAIGVLGVGKGRGQVLSMVVLLEEEKVTAT